MQFQHEDSSKTPVGDGGEDEAEDEDEDEDEDDVDEDDDSSSEEEDKKGWKPLNFVKRLNSSGNAHQVNKSDDEDEEDLASPLEQQKAREK
jgi:hypothetical protein